MCLPNRDVQKQLAFEYKVMKETSGGLMSLVFVFVFQKNTKILLLFLHVSLIKYLIKCIHPLKVVMLTRRACSVRALETSG